MNSDLIEVASKRIQRASIPTTAALRNWEYHSIRTLRIELARENPANLGLGRNQDLANRELSRIEFQTMQIGFQWFQQVVCGISLV